MDNDTFRENFPEFDVNDYPDPMLTFWTTVAGIYVDQTVWGMLYDVAMQLVLAHHLVLAKNNIAIPGQGTGLSTAESAGDVSVSYDTQNTVEERGGAFNLTTYGRQFLRMSRLIGGVAVQIC